MKTPEAELKEKVKKLLDLLKPQLWYWMPVPTGFGIRGIPDFVGCWYGHFFAIETKAPRGKTTKWQEAIHQLIRVAGGSVCVARDIEDVKKFLVEVRNGKLIG